MPVGAHPVGRCLHRHANARVPHNGQLFEGLSRVDSIVTRSLWPRGELTWIRFWAAISSMLSVARTALAARPSVKIGEFSIGVFWN